MSMNMVEHDPWGEGFRARRRGASTDANPYRQLTDAWFRWADGWKDLDEHLADKVKSNGQNA
jgi:hypothetical protein